VDVDSKDIYFIMAPNGKRVLLPKELFEAISDFLVTRKHCGSITIEYQGGEIRNLESRTTKSFPTRSLLPAEGNRALKQRNGNRNSEPALFVNPVTPRDILLALKEHGGDIKTVAAVLGIPESRVQPLAVATAATQKPGDGPEATGKFPSSGDGVGCS
jgi:hypothetical protein